MNIKHAPIFDTKRVERLYSEKDGVPVKYICTTDLSVSDRPIDVFYRDTPHPEFGNRYFGLFRNTHPAADADGNILITNADEIESYEFGMIEDKDGWMWYSQCHHDCLFLDGKMIDGGRQYIRSTGDHVVFAVKNGKFIEKK
jgi:hypothetical protein